MGEPIDRTGGNPAGPGATGTGTTTGRPTTTTGATSTGTTTGAGGGTTTTGAGGGTTTGAGGAGGAGAGGTGGAGGAGGTGPTTCTGADSPITKRLIRLTFNQIVNSIGALLGPTLATAVAKDNSIPDATERSFPPLANPREGSAITDATWSKGDAMATQVGQYVLDNFATVTACATVTDACAQQFIAAFAERAYRRPLVAAETTSLTQTYTELKAAGATIQEGVQFSVSSIIEAPQFLYRSEFGTDWKAAGVLTPYETASLLSYFIADGPPDAPLLDAAKQGKLTAAADIDAQVTRLLGTAPVKQNLQQAMFAYFGATGVLSVTMPDEQLFTQGVAASMYQETTLFINNTLWGPKVTDLLTSRRTWINTNLAFIYNVPAPPGATIDNFVALDLPDNRAGILTSPGYLVARSRPDFPSIIARGLLINASVLCGINPAFNPDLQAEIDKLKGTQNGWTERQKSEYRMTNQPCQSCHQGFDPYGLTVGNFDNLARFQTMDAQGRPIDATTTLPANAGGTVIKNAPDMATQISSNGAFTACVAKNLLVYGLAEASGLSTDSCATRTVTNAFKASTDQSFAALVRAVAASIPLGTRSPGKAM
ncbi:MAG TPA: DUF1592 domain-containing protein [Polyangiaceae bacterium]|nr:DUF1592 domain-containing protein [Polyangiaceae bacterium]